MKLNWPSVMSVMNANKLPLNRTKIVATIVNYDMRSVTVWGEIMR